MVSKIKILNSSLLTEGKIYTLLPIIYATSFVLLLSVRYQLSPNSFHTFNRVFFCVRYLISTVCLYRMASAQKLRENLLSISWGAVNCVAANGQVIITDFPDVFESCQLSYNIIGQEIVLELNFVLSKTSKPTKLETISILAAKDGVKQKMNLSQTKWTTSWAPAPVWVAPARRNNCQYCGLYPTASFDILIDLNPDLDFTMTKGAKHVLDHILNLWKTNTLSDVTFRCKGKEIKAHVMIVASCSPVLAAMFGNDFKEKHEKVVNIKDITPETFSRLLRFMYVGDASLETVAEDDLSELLTAADKYGVETLKEDCALHMSRNLKIENAARFLVLAHLHNSSVLHETTLEFMSKNAKAVCSRKDWMDVIKNYPELCFQAMQLMVGL